jgi:cyclopropane fatty-acyl-phospholipid synthase-like methyltransferase
VGGSLICSFSNTDKYGFRCGWGSGALYFAEMLPNSNVTAFSNSRTQKVYIDEKAKEKGLKNLTVITGNVVDYEFEKESFDRVVSIEVCHMIVLPGLTDIYLAL